MQIKYIFLISPKKSLLFLYLYGMHLVITEKQLKDLIRLKSENQTLREQGEGEGSPEAGTSSDGDKKTGASKWESGVTRGPANQIGVTKWSDVVGSKITRGKANPLSEQEDNASTLVKILRPDGKIMYAPKGTEILSVFDQSSMDGGRFKESLKNFISKEKGGLGNNRTQAWIPSNWSKIITLNSISQFRTPDGKQYKSVIIHPTLQNIKGTWQDFYQVPADPYGWKFAGYYNDTRTEVFKSIEPTKGFWDEWKYLILAGASILAAIIIPGIGGLILSIGIDLVSAGMQYLEGDTLGSGISVILAFIPVIGKAIPALKISEEVAGNIAKGLAPLKTEAEIIAHVKKLPQTERYFMQKLLSEDPKKLTALIEKEIYQNVKPENVSDIVKNLNELIKTKKLDKVGATKWYKSLGLKRFGFDVSASGLVLWGGAKYGEFLNNKAQKQAMEGIMPSTLDMKIAELSVKAKNQDIATYSMIIAPIFEKYGKMYDVDDDVKLDKLRKIQLGVLEAFLKNPDEDLEILADKLDK